MISYRRFRSHLTEDQGRGETARVPAHRDPSDLDAGGVQTRDWSARAVQHPTASVRREPAYRVRYGRCDLHSHERRNLYR